MHRKSAEHNPRTNASSPVSGQRSVPGPSTSLSPAPQTLAAATTSIKETGTDIINLIGGWRKKTPAAQALGEVLRTSLKKYENLLNTTEMPDAATFASLQDIINILREIQRDVKVEVRPRKRHVVKGAVTKLFGVDHPDIFSSSQTKVTDAFRTLELALQISKSTEPTNVLQQGGTIPARGRATSLPSRHGWSGHANTTLDTLETALQLTVSVSEVVPLAGSILKAVGSIGLAIIKILNGVINNKEEAQSLAKYIGDLVATVEGFEENNGTQIGEETIVKLNSFEATLNSVHGELESFISQGGFRQGVSHIRNKEVLAGCDTQIRRSFMQLQVHLSLDTVRLLTNLEDADAQRVRRELLDRLGDADTGATDKASDPADLMCLKGTRVELLDEVDRWAEDPSSQRVLWINGVAGCGKTAMAATIASRREEQSATAIFHFSRSNQPQNKRVICSIARQLAQKVARGTEKAPENLVLSSIKANPDIATGYLSAQFKHLLVDPLSKLLPGSPPVLIIIDALDEWDNQDSAAKLVHQIHEHNAKLPPSIKFILTSRKESHLSQAFDAPRIACLVRPLALDIAPPAIVNHDIRAYLTTHFDPIRSDSSELSASNWPGNQAIDDLVALSGGLFQWASTVIRFVGKKSHKVRLKEIFAKPNQLGDIDALYRLVLTTILQANDRPSITALLHHVLGSIVAAPTPISLNTLIYLHASDHDTVEDTTSDIKEILAALGSLLIVPVHPNEAIRVLHPSIIDFLTDPQRCTNIRLYVDPVAENRRLALLCLSRMQRDLKQDICGIGDARKFNADPYVQDLVSKHISDPLRYTCRYWAEHLLASRAANDVEVDVSLQDFCTRYLLFWFEVMSLTGMFQQAVAAIKVAEKWVMLSPPGPANSTVQALLHDARRLLLMYSEPIAANAAHLYLSVLPTVPAGTDLAKTYRDFIDVGIRTLAGPVGEYWPGSLWVADRHSGPVRCCAFSPDGKILASGSEDDTLRLWDVETGVQRGSTLEGHAGKVTSVAFSSDGRTLASGSHDTTLRTWDVETGVQRGPTLKGHTKSVSCLAFSSDGRTLASGSADNTLRLWDIETGVQKGSTLEGHTDEVICLAFSSNGRTVVSGSYDTTLRLWDVETGVQKGSTLEGHTDEVTCLEFSSDGRIVISGSYDNTLRLWDSETGLQKGSTLEGHTDGITCMAFSSDGRTVASGSHDKTLRLWDIEAGVQQGPTLEGHTSSVICLAFSSDVRTLASGSHDKTLRLWDVEAGVQKGWTLEGHTYSVNCLAFSSNGRTVVSGSNDTTLRLWEVETGLQKGPTLQGHADRINCLAFSSVGRTVASGSDDKTLRLWDVEAGLQKGPTLKGHTNWVNCVAFSPDGRILASGSDDMTLRLWNIEAGVQKGPTLEGHTDRVSRLAFSPDGRTLASVSKDTTLRLWDVETGVQRRQTLKGHTKSVSCLAFSSDGRTLASGSADNTLRLWDVETTVQKGPALDGHTSAISCLAFSPDGRTLASGSHDNTLRLWDVEIGVQRGIALQLVFLPHLLMFPLTGGYVTVISHDGSAVKWDVDKETWVSLVAPYKKASEAGLTSSEAIIRVGQEGWVHFCNLRWFWLPAAYGRGGRGKLLDDKFVFSADRHVCIIDASKIMYLMA